jgi:hypothetical protein
MPAAAFCGDPDFKSSTSQVCTTIEGCVSDSEFDSTGGTAFSSRSEGAQAPEIGFNYVVSATATHADGLFDFALSVAGATDIFEFGSYSGSADSAAARGDCLTFGGHSGAGVARLPIRVVGGTSIEWTIGGSYVPPPSFEPGFVRFRILCGVLEQGGAFGNCTDFDVEWTGDGAIDTTVDIEFGFSFGTPIGISLDARLDSRLGYLANGTGPGVLQGLTSVDLGGTLQPLVVTDTTGAPLANVTLTSDSGFDYLTAPEPGAAATAAGLLASLALRRRLKPSR